MPRAKKPADVPVDRLDEMLVRLKLGAIRDQLDSLLDEAARSNLSARETLSKPKLLIVDELGYLPLEPDAAHLFFQLVSRRYETGALTPGTTAASSERQPAT